MKYETFYPLFAAAGFTYVTTDSNADIYSRDGRDYRFCFLCGHISHGMEKSRFGRGIEDTKRFLINYFDDEKKNQTTTT